MKAQSSQTISQGRVFLASRLGRIVASTVWLGLSYVAASIAIETASLWFYAGTVVSLFMAVRSLVTVLRSK